MIRKNELLSNVRIASPCPASWSEMDGDETVRFCKECRLNVYNLSGMSAEDAEGLLRQREGRLCVRYYQRSDGGVMTKDCPKGLRAVRVRLVRAWGLAVAATLSAFGCSNEIQGAVIGDTPAPENGPVMGKLPSQPPQPTMGMVALPEQRVGRVADPPLMGEVSVAPMPTRK